MDEKKVKGIELNWEQFIEDIGKFKNYIENRENHLLFNFLIGYILETLGSNESLSYYKEGVKLDTKRHILLLFSLINRLWRERRWKEILEELQFVDINIGKAEYESLIRLKGFIEKEIVKKREDAQLSYTSILKYIPSSIDALLSLEELKLKRADLKGLNTLYEKLIPLSKDPIVRSFFLYMKGNIEYNHLKNRVAGRELLKEALLNYKDNFPSLFNLYRLDLEEKNWNDIIEVLDHIAQIGDPLISSQLLYRTTIYYEEVLHREDQAEEILEKIIDFYPELTPKLVLYLDRLIFFYEKNGRWEKLIELLEKIKDIFPTPQQKLVYLYKLATIYDERVENYEQAITYYKEILKLSPYFTPALQSLTKIYSKLERWEELVNLHKYEAERTQDPLQKASCFYRAAEISLNRLNDVRLAKEYFQKSLHALPNYIPSFRALERVYKEEENWVELVELYEFILDKIENKKKKVPYLVKLAEIYEEKLKDNLSAIEILKQILDIEPDNFTAIYGLNRLYEREERWSQLIEILQHEIEFTKDIDKIPILMYQCGEVAEEKLKDTELAFKFYKDTVKYNPQYLPALISLGRLYSKTGNWKELIELHEREIEVTENITTKINLYYKIGEIYREKLGELDKAIQYFKKSLELDEVFLPSIYSLEQIYIEKGLKEERIQLLQKLIKSVDDNSRKAELLTKIGELYESLNRIDEAIEYYKKGWESSLPFIPAFEGLERLYLVTERWEELLSLYKEIVNFVQSSKLIIYYLFGIAWIYENKLNLKEEAIPYYKRILEIEPENLIALYHLKRVYEAIGGKESEILEIEEKFASLIIDDKFKERYLLRTALVYDAILDRRKESLERYYSLFKQSEDLPLILAMFLINPEPLLSKPKVEEVINRLISYYRENRLIQLALLYAKAILKINQGELEEAKRVLLEIVQKEPLEIASWLLLERVVSKIGGKEEYGELLERLAQLNFPPEQRSEFYLRASLLYEELHKKTKSLELLEKSVLSNPENEEAYSKLILQLEREEKWDKLLEILTYLGSRIASKEKISDFFLKAARIKKEKLKDRIGAISLYNKSLYYAPDNIELLFELAELFYEDEQWNEVIVTLNRIIQVSKDKEKLKEARILLAKVEYEKLGEVYSALQHLERCLEEDPNNIKALETIVSIYINEGRWKDAEKELEKLIGLSDDISSIIEYYIKLSELQAYNLKNLQKAITTLTKAWHEFPGNTEILWKLVELIKKSGDLIALKNLYESVVNSEEIQIDNQSKEKIYVELAEIYESYLSDTLTAINYLKKGLEVTPSNLDIMLKIGSLYKSIEGRKNLAEYYYLKVLSIEPFHIEALRELCTLWKGMGEIIKYYSGLEILNYIMALSGKEKEDYITIRRRGGVYRLSKAFDFESFSTIFLSPIERSAPAKILRYLDEILDKVLIDPKDEFINIEYQLTELPESFFNPPLERLFELLNIKNIHYKVYIWDKNRLNIIPGDTYILIFPRMIEESSDIERSFVSALLLYRIFSKSISLIKLSLTEINTLLCATIREYKPDFGKGLLDEDVLERLRKKIKKVLPGKVKKTLATYIEEYLSMREFDLKDLVYASELSSYKFGLLLIGELSTGLDYIKKSAPELLGKPLTTTQEIITTLKSNNLMVELVKWYLSGERFEIIKKLTG